MSGSQAQAFIECWHRVFEQNDPELILPLIHEDVEFYSPAIFAPKRGRQQVFGLLLVVFDIFEGYRVTDTWTKGNDVMFEFEVRVGKYALQGIDRFRLNEAGLVVQMKVWIRPLTGLKALARAVMERQLDSELAGRGALSRALLRARARASIFAGALQEAFK